VQTSLLARNDYHKAGALENIGGCEKCSKFYLKLFEGMKRMSHTVYIIIKYIYLSNLARGVQNEILLQQNDNAVILKRDFRLLTVLSLGTADESSDLFYSK